MATEDWIQESLARLESLEEERNRHEAALETANDSAALRMHTQAIERLEAKIRSLYAELEAAAEQGDGSAEADSDDEADDDADADADDHDHNQSGSAASSNVETRLFRREDVAAQAAVIATAPAQPAPVSTPVASPFGGSPAASAPASPFGGSAPASVPASPFGGSAPAASPFGGSAEVAPASPFGGSAEAAPASPFGGSAPASNMFGSSSGAGFSSAPASSFSGSGASFEDDEGRRSGAPWGLIIGLVVLLGGVGGYFALRPKDEPPPVVPTGPATVIKAIEVPPDTQGPKTVKGGNVDSISGTQYKEGRSQPSGGGGGSSAPAGDKPKKKDPRTKIEKTDDPLAGID
ncbi:MAG: hypothetical protein H0T76_14950 [Nannocystis sp.]|nr:hypothetical protein [Nannocystis sp.]